MPLFFFPDLSLTLESWLGDGPVPFLILEDPEKTEPVTQAGQESGKEQWQCPG